MRIALDYDGTYTLAPDLWDAFIQAAIASGNEVRIVTSRHADMRPQVPGCRVICTGMQPKGPACVAMGWVPDVWIDDKPHRIFA